MGRSTAAQVAARRLRRHGQHVWAPARASGEQPSGLPQVELYIGGWIDVTALGLVRYEQGVSIQTGMPDETQATQPGTMNLRLDNRDGRFTPSNPLGPYYGLFDRNTPCRINVPSGNARSYRFCGEVPSWPADWDPTGVDAWLDLQVSGPLRRLGQGNAPVDSPIFISVARSAVIPGLVAYWPCEDAVGSTQLASGIGGSPASIIGAPTLASNSDFAGSAALPVMNAGSIMGVVPAYKATGESAVRFLWEIPSGGLTDLSVIALVATTGSVRRVTLVYGASFGGSVQVNAYDINGTLLFASGFGAIGLAGVGINGAKGRLTLEMTQNGTEVDVTVGMLGPGWPNAQEFGATWTSSTFGTVTGVTLAPNGGMGASVMGHVTVQSQFTTLFDLAPQMAGYAGEHAGGRIGRLCQEYGLAYTEVGGNSVPMGVQPISSLLALVQECVDADGGLLFELPDQVGLGYRTRDDMLNQTPGLVLDYAGAQLSEVPKAVPDDAYTRNDVTVTRTGGSSARLQQTTGTLTVAQPPAGVGPYQTSTTLNVQYDSQLTDLAGWRLHLGTCDDPRFPLIAVQLASNEFEASTVLRGQALGVAPGDLLQVLNPPGPWMDPDPISVLALGRQEVITQFAHRIGWNSRPGSPWRTAVADDAVLSHAGTDGTVLAAALGPTDTGVQLATAADPGGLAFPLWTTDPADFPFDLAVAGERVTMAGPGATLGTDPFLASGTAAYVGQSASLAMDPGRPWPTGADGVLAAYAAQTLLVTPAGGVACDVVGAVSAAGGIATSTGYTVWGWVYNPSGRSYDVFANWFLNGVYVSTSNGATTAVTAGAWTLLEAALTSPGAGVNQASLGVQDPGTPAATDLFWVWGLNATLTSSLTQASSPQSFTVVRSANGVVKPQPAGTLVDLWQPYIPTLY